MRKPAKAPALLLFFLCLLPFSALPQESPSEESIHITTYYPSPYGSYQQIKSKVLLLEAADGPPELTSGKEQEGMLYYDKDEGFKYYNGKEWTSLGGSTAPLVGGDHSESDCMKAGGEVVNTAGSLKQCRFDRSSCPSGWTQYLNWATTTPKTCQTLAGYYTFSACGPACTTGSHDFADSAVETCAYTGVRYNDGYVGCNSRQSLAYGGCNGSCTCRANITRIGCY